MMWIVSFEITQEQITRIHMIGPVFIADISVKTFEKKLFQGDYSVKTKNSFMRILHSVPVISVTTYFQYGQMLHFTVTGEKIPTGAFQFQNPLTPDYAKNDSLPFQVRTISESHGTWAAEQELVRRIEDGNLNYQEQEQASCQSQYQKYLNRFFQNRFFIHSTLPSLTERRRGQKSRSSRQNAEICGF